MTALLATSVVFAILFTFWSFLNWVADLIEKAQAEIRASEPRHDGVEHGKERVI
jgi:hypothetical protein